VRIQQHDHLMRMAGLRRQRTQPVAEACEAVHRGSEGSAVGCRGIALLPARTQADLGTKKHALDIERQQCRALPPQRQQLTGYTGMRPGEESDQRIRSVDGRLLLRQQRRNTRCVQIEPPLVDRRPRHQRVLFFHRPPSPPDAAREHRRIGKQEVVDVERIAQDRPGARGNPRQPWRRRLAPAAIPQPGRRDHLVAGRTERQHGSRHHVHRIQAIKRGKIADALPLRAEQPAGRALCGGMGDAAPDVVEHDARKHAPAIELALRVVLYPLRPAGQPAESGVVRKRRVEVVRRSLDAEDDVLGLTADRLDQRLMVHRLVGKITHRQPLAASGKWSVHGADNAVVPVHQRGCRADRAAALVLRPRRAPLGRAGAENDA